MFSQPSASMNGINPPLRQVYVTLSPSLLCLFGHFISVVGLGAGGVSTHCLAKQQYYGTLNQACSVGQIILL